MSVVLKTNGQVFSGWIAAEVERSINAIAGRFIINFTDKWQEGQHKWHMKSGDSCSIELENETVITGFIDSLKIDLTADARTLSISGRDKTGDLVDSGSLLEEKSFADVSLGDMATQAVKGFDVNVSPLSDNSKAKIKATSIQYNETVFEFISRIAHNQGVLCYPDKNGGIIFSDVSTEVIDAISLKNKIIEINAKTDSSKLFHDYIVISHNGSAQEQTKTIRKVAQDLKNTTKRRKIIVVSSNTNDAGAQARADWEKACHIARSFQASVKILGWKNSKGQLWDVNKLISLDAEAAGIVKGNYLIESVKFILDARKGQITQLNLVLPNAYNAAPESVRKEDAEGMQQ